MTSYRLAFRHFLLILLTATLVGVAPAGCGSVVDGTPDAGPECPDGDDDNDGVCNADDVCPGGNDGVDGDGDTVPDFCDTCPQDANDDSDNDGVCDSDDACPGSDDGVDDDGDAVPNGCDICPGADDNVDENNNQIPDGCEGGDYVFLTSSNGQPGFYRYTIDTDTWDQVATPPVRTSTQITNDGARVYLMGQDNTIYAYDPQTDRWTPGMPGPGQETGSPIGMFQWTTEGFFYVHDGTNVMYVNRNGNWISFQLPEAASSAGSWDRLNNRLYVRIWTQLGFMAIDTTDNQVVDVLLDQTSVGENSRSGSYYGGYFYSRTVDGPLMAFNVVTHEVTDTGVVPLSRHTGTATDHVRGRIYISGYGNDPTSFQVYDPATNTLTTLADQPSVPDHSTITVMRNRP